MSELDYSLLDAIKAMCGEDVKNTAVHEEEYSINSNSTDIEILDYIMLFICARARRYKNYYKGGYTLMKLMPDYARYSHDIDFSISTEEEYKELIPVLTELGEDLLRKGIIIKYEVKPTIHPTISGGIELYRDNIKKLGIDIGWHDTSYGMVDWEILGFTEKRFSVERMLSDKISAIYSRKRFRRSKDLYDVLILYNNFDINYTLLADCIDKRGTIDWANNPFREEVLVEYAKAYDKLVIGNPLVIEKPSFRDCIHILSFIVNKLKELGRYEELSNYNWK